ncbi:hypothetical protein V2J09_006197 [Rumex salicifolius]
MPHRYYFGNAACMWNVAKRAFVVKMNKQVSLSSPNLNWVFTISSRFLQTISLSNPLENLLAVFSSIRNRGNYHQPDQEGSKFDYELALVSALKSCSSLIAITEGCQIHCLIQKSGLESNIFIQNSLISMYSKSGRLDDAKLIFDSCSKLDLVSCNIMLGAYVKSGKMDDAFQLFGVMPEKGCVAYTTMIMGLVQARRWVEAYQVFKNMRHDGVTPNEVTLGTIISSYSHLGGIWDVRGFHGLTTKLGLNVFVLVSTNLLHMYCICSSLVDARSLFDEMDDKNIVSWNVMLNGYSKAGLVDLTRDLFESSPEKDIVSWGTMVDAYVQVDRLHEALFMYRIMLRTGLGPNDVMIVDLVSACGRLKALCEGKQLHSSTIKIGFDCYNFVQSTIIHFYAACHKMDLACLQFESACKDHLTSWNALLGGFVRNGMIDEAEKIFNEMPERDVFSWSSMISGYSQTGKPDVALKLFLEMVLAGVLPNEITMVSVLSAIASLGSLEKGIWACEYIKTNSIPLNDNLIAAVIDMYAKSGSISTALEFFNQIKDKVTSISPWNAVLCGLAVHGHAHESLSVFEALQGVSIKPNSITFIGVLAACCHAGMVEAGKQYFNIMKSRYNIDPNIKHYGCMVDLLGRSGSLQEAEDMIRKMPMKADVVIWGTLLAACRTHGNVEIGERAANSLASLDTSHGAGRVLLSNLYAEAGRWDDAFVARRAIEDQSMVRLPGCSGVV